VSGKVIVCTPSARLKKSIYASVQPQNRGVLDWEYKKKH